MFLTVAKKETAATAKAAKAAEAEKAKVKKRVKRDKDAPKKPMSPFFCYQAVRRPQLKVEQPTLNNTEIIKVSISHGLQHSFRPWNSTRCWDIKVPTSIYHNFWKYSLSSI